MNCPQSLGLSRQLTNISETQHMSERGTPVLSQSKKKYEYPNLMHKSRMILL